MCSPPLNKELPCFPDVCLCIQEKERKKEEPVPLFPCEKCENAGGIEGKKVWRGRVTSKLKCMLGFSRGRNVWRADNIFLCCLPASFYRVLAKNFPKVRGFSQSQYKEVFVRRVLPIVPSSLLVTEAAQVQLCFWEHVVSCMKNAATALAGRLCLVK